MLKKNILVLTGIALMALTGCGGTGTETSSNASDATNSSGTSGTVENIEFFGWGSAEEQSNFQTMINQFMVDNPNIKVAYSATSSDNYMATLKNKTTSLPDVFYMPDYEFMQWADSGRLYDMSNDVTQSELDSVWKLGTDMYRYDATAKKLGTGALLGLPKDLGPYLLCYNKTLLNQILTANNLTVGLPSASDPMTWDGFRDYLKAIKYTDNGKKVFGIGAYEMMHAIYSNNADYWSSDGKTQTITSDNFVNAMQFIANLYLTDGVMPSPSEQNSMNAYQRFLTGGSVFAWIGAWDFKALWEGTNFDFDVIPTPVGPAEGAKSTSWVGSVAYSVSKKSAHIKAAMTLAKYLTFSTSAAKLNYTLGQAMPNVKSVAENDWLSNVDLSGRKLNPANKQLYLDTVNGTDKVCGHNRSRYYLYDNTPITDFEDSLEPVFSGSKTAKAFMGEYAPTFQSNLDDSNSNLN